MTTFDETVVKLRHDMEAAIAAGDRKTAVILSICYKNMMEGNKLRVEADMMKENIRDMQHRRYVPFD